MNVVDSSAWIEYFVGGENSEEFAPAIEATEDLVVPSLCLYEVFKRTSQLRGEGSALEAVAVMLAGDVVDLSASLALEAAKISLGEDLPMADAVILATSRRAGATLWTQDAHFASITGVEYRAKT